MASSLVYLNILAHLLQLAFVLFVAFAVLTKRGGLLFRGCPGGLNIPKWLVVFVVLAAVSAVYIGIKRSTYLPFLGETAFPPRALRVDQESDVAKKAIRVALPMTGIPDNSLVVYWAASTSEVPYPTPDVAYLNSENVGVTAVKDGVAVLRLNCPAEYMVNGVLQKRHIHFRVQSKPGSGMFGPVQTVPINCS